MNKHCTFLDQQHLRVGEVDFRCLYDGGDGGPVAKGFLPVAKDRSQVERYLRLSEELRPRVIVEIGIQRGGSTALLHALNQPLHLVAIELESEPATALAAYIQAHALQAIIRPHYGIDQADRAAVASIMTEELAGEPIDLVIDDASHLLEQTRISFETLFPLMRPGGLYVIEDWNAEHLLADAMEAALADPQAPGHAALVDSLAQVAAVRELPQVRLIRLPLELVLARANARDVIREVRVMDNWIVVRRGDEHIDPATFRLADLVTDHFLNLRPLD